MLEEKIDTLTKEIVALRQAIEKGGTAGAAASTEKASTGRGRNKKVEPKHDADEVGTMMRKAAKLDKPKVQKYIKGTDSEDLADMLTKPETFDDAFDFAEKIVNAAQDDDDDV